MSFKQHTVRVAAVLALGAVLIPAHATNGYFAHGYGIKAKGMGALVLLWFKTPLRGPTTPLNRPLRATVTTSAWIGSGPSEK